MATQAVFEGVIPHEGIGGLLGGLEEVGTTGVLAFQSESGSGTIRLVHGQVAGDKATEDEARALEILLSLREGQFAVYPKLPHLPVSRGTDTTRRGSLAVHPPAELMHYCEDAGLTGRLLLEHRGRLAIGYYEKGELVDVSIDGGTPGDFVTALGWTEGTFRVDAVPPPRETLPPVLRGNGPEPINPTRLPTEEEFEAGLREAGRSDETPISGLVPRLEDQDDDLTIRVIRRPGHEGPDRHREHWQALDYNPSFAGESATTGPVKIKDDGRPIGSWRTLGWVFAVLVIVTGCLWFLASLPPLE